MKKLMLLPIFLLSVCAAHAFNDKKMSYINLGAINSTMSQTGAPDLTCGMSASFTAGRTYSFHKKPIGGFLRFGVDVTWFELNYENYSIQHKGYWGNESYLYHEAEYSLHIGPSITLNPFGKCYIHGYYRFAPSYSALYMHDSLYGGYSSYWVGGGSISIGKVGLGIENRVGDSNYRLLLDSESGKMLFEPNKVKHNGWRLYLSFKF